MLVIFLVIGIMYMVIRNGGGFVPTLVNVMTIIGFLFNWLQLSGMMSLNCASMALPIPLFLV